MRKILLLPVTFMCCLGPFQDSSAEDLGQDIFVCHVEMKLDMLTNKPIKSDPEDIGGSQDFRFDTANGSLHYEKTDGSGYEEPRKWTIVQAGSQIGYDWLAVHRPPLSKADNRLTDYANHLLRIRPWADERASGSLTAVNRFALLDHSTLITGQCELE